VVVGGEKRGISRAILEMSDQNIRIGYGRDFSGSLPTSESAAIIAFEISKFNHRIK
jgi:tRNA G18 (ribose-2'-O)-methylase SpoU